MLDKAVESIRTLSKSVHGKRPLKVLIQLPDGMKSKATEIVTYLQDETGCECHIWAGSCWGACDIPDVEGYDLLLHFGHNDYGFENI